MTATAYGLAWLEHVHTDGRVYPSWKQYGADTGRMACREPAFQQMPRGCRSAVCAPPGRHLVKADYSQIELRIAAAHAKDPAMLQAFRDGADLHTLTAQRVLGVPEVTKEARKLAKALNFGLLYGMGAKTFRVYARTNYGLASGRATRPNDGLTSRWQTFSESSSTAPMSGGVSWWHWPGLVDSGHPASRSR